jgi:hypothetical protein
MGGPQQTGAVPCFKTGKEMRERLNRTPTI